MVRDLRQTWDELANAHMGRPTVDYVRFTSSTISVHVSYIIFSDILDLGSSNLRELLCDRRKCNRVLDFDDLLDRAIMSL